MTSSQRRSLIVTALLFSMFLAAMEATAVSTAMPTVIGDLGGVDLYAWVFTAYMLTSTVSVPIYGKLADLFGRKRVLLAGIALFLIGSALSGVSTSIEMLILFRGIQGLGAGSVQTTSLTVIGDLFSLEERAKIQGLFAAVWGLAGFSGPLLGGLIVESFSWHWVFFINIPFGLVSVLILLLAYQESLEKKEIHLDWLGALLLVGAALALLGAANDIHPNVLLPASIVLTVLLVINERRVKEALLPYDLFAKRLMVIASATGILSGAAMFSAVTYLPLYVQGAAGGTPTEAGAALTPMMLGWPVASTLSGRLIPRFGFRKFVVFGLALIAIGSFCLPLGINLGWSLEALYAPMALFGIGMGCMNTAVVIAVQTSVAWQQRGIATASTMFFRVMGGTLAVGFLGGLLARRLARDPEATEEVINSLLGPEHGRGLDPELLVRLTESLSDSLIPLFWLIFTFALGSWLLSLWFPEKEGS